MALNASDRWRSRERERRTDQIGLVRRRNRVSGVVVTTTDDDSEIPVMLVPDRVLVGNTGPPVASTSSWTTRRVRSWARSVKNDWPSGPWLASVCTSCRR